MSQSICLIQYFPKQKAVRSSISFLEVNVADDPVQEVFYLSHCFSVELRGTDIYYAIAAHYRSRHFIDLCPLCTARKLQWSVKVKHTRAYVNRKLSLVQMGET